MPETILTFPIDSSPRALSVRPVSKSLVAVVVKHQLILLVGDIGQRTHNTVTTHFLCVLSVEMPVHPL